MIGVYANNSLWCLLLEAGFPETIGVSTKPYIGGKGAQGSAKGMD